MNKEEKIDVICRQTDYDKEKAKKLLKEYDDNYLKVIEFYLGVNKKNDNDKVNASFTNTRYAIMRNKLNVSKNLIN